MADAYEVLQNFQLLVFLGLALAAVAHWFRRRSQPAAWIAATFGVLGAVILAGMFLRTNRVAGWSFGYSRA